MNTPLAPPAPPSPALTASPAAAPAAAPVSAAVPQAAQKPANDLSGVQAGGSAAASAAAFAHVTRASTSAAAALMQALAAGQEEPAADPTAAAPSAALRTTSPAAPPTASPAASPMPPSSAQPSQTSTAPAPSQAAYAPSSASSSPGLRGDVAAAQSLTTPALTTPSPATSAAATVVNTPAVSHGAGAVSTSASAAPVPTPAQLSASMVHSGVRLSAPAQQALRQEAFARVLDQLVRQLPPSAQTPSPSAAAPSAAAMPAPTAVAAAQWPATAAQPHSATVQMLSALVGVASAAQGVPQQVVNVQPWTAALARAVLAAAQNAPDRGPTALDRILAALDLDGDFAGDVPMPDHGSRSAGTRAADALGGVRIPALQTWLLRQGVIEGADGIRGFTLSLKVPVLWARMQHSLGVGLAALGGVTSALAAGADAGMVGTTAVATGSGLSPSVPTSAGLRLPFAGAISALPSVLHAGVVLQPAPVPGTSAAIEQQLQLLRTSAVLELHMQPLQGAQLAHSQAQAASAGMAAQLMAAQLGEQAVAAFTGQRSASDPWVQMAQLYASGQQPRQWPEGGEQPGLCHMAGCQYEGRAVCAQPFCAQMNYLWSVARAQSRA